MVKKSKPKKEKPAKNNKMKKPSLGPKKSSQIFRAPKINRFSRKSPWVEKLKQNEKRNTKYNKINIIS